MKVGITGYSGFLGRDICRELMSSNYEVVKLGRSLDAQIKVDLSNYSQPNLTSLDVLILCAGLAHKKAQSERDYDLVNNVSTIRLVNDAYKAGVRKIVFISTVAVYGKSQGINISESNSDLPSTAYGKSKYNAEQELKKVFQLNGDIDLLILRLPLIVGKEAPGNLGKLEKSILSGNHISLAGNTAKKSIVFRSDVSRTIVAWLKNEVKGEKCINLVSGNPTFNEVENHLAKIHNKSIVRIPLTPLFALISFLYRSLRIKIPLLSKVGLSLTFSSDFDYPFMQLMDYSFENLKKEYDQDF